MPVHLASTYVAGGEREYGRYANPVVVPPQVAIVGAGSIRDEPVAMNGEVVIHPILPLSLTFDHRVCDGGVAGGFLRYVADAIENPGTVLADL